MKFFYILETQQDEFHLYRKCLTCTKSIPPSLENDGVDVKKYPTLGEIQGALIDMRKDTIKIVFHPDKCPYLLKLNGCRDLILPHLDCL